MAAVKKPSATTLAIKEVADRLGENSQTVKGWRRRGLFRGAMLVDTPRGPIWEIPLSDVESFERPILGRPKGKSARTKTSRDGKRGPK